jgi:hypothetical protein
MSSTIIIIFMIGIAFVIGGIAKNRLIPTDRHDKIIYRYIPRTFEEEQRDPPLVSDIFETMFSQPDPWVTSMRYYDVRKQENVNRYFITQL